MEYIGKFTGQQVDALLSRIANGDLGGGGTGLDEYQLQLYLENNDYINSIEDIVKTLGFVPISSSSLSSYAKKDDVSEELKPYATKENLNNVLIRVQAVENAGYATATYVDTSISNLINGAPSTLDTLKEIADAFAESEEVIIALDIAIGQKASKEEVNETLKSYAKTDDVNKALEDYAKTENVNKTLEEYTKKSEVESALTPYIKESVADGRYATIENLNSLSNKVDGVASDVEDITENVDSLSNNIEKFLGWWRVENGVLVTDYDILTSGQFAAQEVGLEGGGTGGAAYLADLYDVDLSSLTSGDLLAWNGTDWVNISQSVIKPDLKGYATKSEIPTKVSQLVNDKNYLTEHQDLGHLATKQEVDNIEEAISDIADIRQKANSALQSIPSEYITEQELSNKGYALASQLDKKQDIIEDIEKIRENAALGATALQTVPSEYVTEDELSNKGYATTAQLDNKQDKISDLATIRANAALGATALQSVPSEYITEEELEAKGYATDDTKNTAGATNTSYKIFLVGATSQGANPQTYSHDTAYVGTDGYLYSNSEKVDMRLTTSLVPAGTAIPANADLNDPAYLKVGKYYISKSADAATLKNCPIAAAFSMEVYNPLSTVVDNETTGTWVYRLRKITEYNTGVQYMQYSYVGSTANKWTYNDWYFVPRAKFTLDTTDLNDGSAALGSKTKGVYIDSTGTMYAMTYSLNKDVPSDAVFTDNSVTGVANHYEPQEDTSKALSASGGAVTDIANSSNGVQVITGLKRDAAGHVVGVTSSALKATAGTYSKPSGGIPKSDLDSSVQTSLGKADSALQSDALNSYAKTADVLDKTSAQTVTGRKTFNVGPDFVSSGDTDAVHIGTDTRFNVHGTDSTVFGMLSSKFTLGSSSYDIQIRGKQPRPPYNGKDLALKSDVDSVGTRVTSLEAYFATADDSDNQINKWNEIVSFLNATEGTTLDGILAAYATKEALSSGLNDRYTKQNVDDLFSNFEGTGNITTLGTITSGTWNGNKIANAYLANSKVTISGVDVSLGGAITQAELRTRLGLDDLIAWYNNVGFAFGKNADGTYFVDGDFLTNGQFAAGEAGTTGSGSGLMLLTTWATDGGDYSGYALGGNLGIELNTRVKELEGKATSVSFSQALSSGKEIGTISVDGVAKKLYAPKNYAWDDITGTPTIPDAYTKAESNSNFYGWQRGPLDVDKLYDGGLYMVASGANLPFGSAYAEVLSLPYRKLTGNIEPDFGAQIALPNGDDSTKPNSMFFRTSLKETWNPWQEVLTTSNLSAALITSAIGYTPYNAANFTQANIKSTLGISDWALASSKPSYSKSDVGLGNVENKSSATIRGEITSSNVTTALGFTPYNASNPSGFITASALADYLPLNGGTMKAGKAIRWEAQSGKTPYMGQYATDGSFLIAIEGINTNHGLVLGGTSGNLLWKGNRVLDASNYATYVQTAGDGRYLKIADIGSQSVSYATNAGSVAWSGVTNRPTALSQFTDDVVSGKYLSLSGGEISGAITYGSGRFFVDGTYGTAIRYGSNTLHITNDCAYYNFNELIHSGNYKNYALSAEGSQYYRFTDSEGTYLGLFLQDSSSNNLWYAVDKNGTWNVLIHDNNIGNYSVGSANSANRLTNARTIWGRSFNGTDNVDGELAFFTDAKIQSYNNLSLYINALGNNTLINANYGNVGIGTTTPSHKLDVNGSFNATSGYINGNALYHTGNFNPSNYLPLSGGTLAGELTIQKDDGDRYFHAIGGSAHLGFGVGGGGDNRGVFDFGDGKWWFYRNNSDNTYLSCSNFYINENTVIHSGNIGSQSVNYASSAGNATELTTVYVGSINYDAYATSLRLIRSWDGNAAADGYPTNYVSGLSVMSGYTGWQMVTYAGGGKENPYFRSIQENGTWNPWRQLAFLDDNVASAQSLVHANGVIGATVASSGNVEFPNGITIGGVRIYVDNGVLKVDGDLYASGQFAGGNFGTDSGLIFDYDAIVEALGYTPANHNNLARVAFSGSYNDLTDKPSGGGGVGNSYRLNDVNNRSQSFPNGVNSVIVTSSTNVYFDLATPEDVTKPCVIYFVKAGSYTLTMEDSSSNIYSSDGNGSLIGDFVVAGHTGMTLVWDFINYRWMAYLQN